MSFRAVAAVGAAAALILGLATPAADASTGPPMPVSTNGHRVQLVSSGVLTPTSFAFGDGVVFVGDGGNSEGDAPPNGGVFAIDNGSTHRIASHLVFVAGVTWHAHALYVSGAALTATGPSWRLMRWSHWNGVTFKTRKILFATGPAFGGFNGIAFGANGRLYVGADVGLLDGNDHGPATTSPHVYQVLSFRANGTGKRVVARGIRQPWQLAFAAGSNAPYVTDLGQDSGAKNPPDFVLHVRAGQNYGFPACNHTVASKCAGFAKPFRRFAPHTDMMGIALRRGTFYLSSFAGLHGAGPGGEVFSMGARGGALKPLIRGFVAPTVGLGQHDGYVYVGELTGQVFRVRI
jgi:glucose/arabinose dehydrogenase